ncbi:MAG: hypothetical protein KBS85_00235 [Lachnospiraceae bacterium]|nr:hypothetical protein [Candidatus Merdinaster equi]
MSQGAPICHKECPSGTEYACAPSSEIGGTSQLLKDAILDKFNDAIIPENSEYANA